jgi:hypothetical protein
VNIIPNINGCLIWLITVVVQAAVLLVAHKHNNQRNRNKNKTKNKQKDKQKINKNIKKVVVIVMDQDLVME